MKLYNINNSSEIVSLHQAVFTPLARDRGLYLPMNIEPLPKQFFESLPKQSFVETAELVLHHLLSEDLSKEEVRKLADDAFNFPAPVIGINKSLSVLELFHGPTLAFKDFGARFMSRLMALLRQKADEQTELYILVATSGDTGGAVASGFYDVPNINVIILYPKEKVSSLQEKQMTTLGKNIVALELEGTFDDCQKLVKDAFVDDELNVKRRLSSANSINIARLIPQSLYYFEAYKQLLRNKTVASVEEQINFCIPSGNFGNLCGGLLAKEMGLPVNRLIAANNSNDPVTQYYRSGDFRAVPAKPTLSNAMDIGNPSNFPRVTELAGSTWNQFRESISAYSFSDQKTIDQIKSFHTEYGYVLDPHTATGILATEAHQVEFGKAEHTVVLSTAHPCKFIEETLPLTGVNSPMPDHAKALLSKPTQKHVISSQYQDFKKFFLSYSDIA